MAAIALVVGPLNATALEQTVAPHVPISESYHRNVRLTPGPPGSDVASLGEPASALEAHYASGAAGYTMKPGDVLQISVWREEELQLQVLVEPDGGISIPLAGSIQAAGRTVTQLQNEIGQRLERYIPDPSVSVAVQEVRGNIVYVVGKVVRPGEFVIGGNVDVMQALSMAGGMNEFASVNDIRILRRQDGKQLTIPFRYGDVESGKNLEQNIVLKSGDVVVVP